MLGRRGYPQTALDNSYPPATILRTVWIAQSPPFRKRPGKHVASWAVRSGVCYAPARSRASFQPRGVSSSMRLTGVVATRTSTSAR